MTSNIGSQYITEYSEKEDYEHIQSQSMQSWTSILDQNFFNRVDEISSFSTHLNENICLTLLQFSWSDSPNVWMPKKLLSKLMIVPGFCLQKRGSILFMEHAH